MGLLTQILGGLAGSALGGSNDTFRRGPSLSPVLLALLPVVLKMLSQRGQRDASPADVSGSAGVGGASAGGGGLGEPGGLDGLGDLIGQLTRKGFGQQASSWIGRGPNEGLPPHAMDEVFGQERLHHIAREAGIGDDDARQGLSELLPEMVDHFTPEGQVPDSNHLSASVDDYLRRLA